MLGGREEMNVIIGIDAGGTSTEFVAFCDGKIVGQVSKKGANLSNNREEAIDTIMGGLHELVQEDWNVSKVVIGMAGVVGNPLVPVLQERINEVYATVTKVYNDVVYAHKAIFKNEPGLLLSAGTGSIAIMQHTKDGEYELIGGYGHLFGDEGSGYDIAQLAIRHAMRQHDYQKEDSFTKAILKELQVDTIRQAVPYLYRAVKGDIARLAKVVADNAAAGDTNAIQILEQSAESFAQYVLDVVNERQLTFEKYALWGSVFVKNPIVQQKVVQLIENALAIELLQTGNISVNEAALYE